VGPERGLSGNHSVTRSDVNCYPPNEGVEANDIASCSPSSVATVRHLVGTGGRRSAGHHVPHSRCQTARTAVEAALACRCLLSAGARVPGCAGFRDRHPGGFRFDASLNDIKQYLRG
jgi:hypothetical protein